MAASDHINKAQWTRRYNQPTILGVSFDDSSADVPMGGGERYRMQTVRIGDSPRYLSSVDHFAWSEDRNDEFGTHMPVNGPNIHGFRTQKRAEIAAGAMTKRHMEGRNLKTGKKSE